MYKCFRNPRILAAAVLMACASVSAQATPVFTDGTTTTAKEVTYKSQFQGDVLTLSIFADGATGTFAGINSLKSLMFSGLKPAGAANRSFSLDGATMVGASTQDGNKCGNNNGGQICFDALNDAIVAGDPLIYKIKFDYSNGTHLDFDKFTVKATYDGLHLNARNRLVDFRVAETVTLNATEVPEPASLAMMGLGLGLVGFARRRKGKAA